jgi:hypothetical protein
MAGCPRVSLLRPGKARKWVPHPCDAFVFVARVGKHEPRHHPARYFFFGTFLPSLRAFESPMAMACFRLVTFFPLRPLRSRPRFISRISVSTFLPALGEYLRPRLPAGFFLAEDFLADDFPPRALWPDAFLVAIFNSFHFRWRKDFRRCLAVSLTR